MNLEDFKNRTIIPEMPPEEEPTEEPMEAEHPNTPVLENMMMNEDEKFSENNQILEHILMKLDDNTVGEYQLVKQAEVVDELRKLQEVIKEKKDVEKMELLGAELVTIKGKPGEPGKPGKTPTQEELLTIIKPLIPEAIPGKDGNDYVLTSEDKKEIAKSIKVPIVEKIIEKTEVIKELPIYNTTNVIKEVIREISKEEIDKIATEINPIIEYSKIKNAPQWPAGGLSRITKPEVQAMIDAIPPAANAFVDLTDTFVSYTGLGGKGLRVNATEDGIDTYTPTDTDEKVKYDASDPTAGYVADKFVAGTGITLAEGTGANENKLLITNSLDLSGYVPYTGATADLNLGDYNLLAEGAVSHDSHGFYFKNQSLANVASFGLGGGQNWTFYDGVKLDGGTASRVLLTDASKNISYSTLTSAELEAIPTTYAKLDGSNHPFTYVKTPQIFPASDSTTAIQILKADGTTNIATFNTTNGYFGLGITPTNPFHISTTSTTPLNIVSSDTNTVLIRSTKTGNAATAQVQLTTVNRSMVFASTDQASGVAGWYDATAGVWRMAIIHTSGNVDIGGGIATSYKLNVAGTTASTLFLSGNGTVGGPAFSFTGDTNTGMYNVSADVLGFATAGSTRMQIGATGEIAVGTSPSAGIPFRVIKSTTQLTGAQTNIYVDGVHTLNANNAFQIRGIYSGVAVNQAGFNATASTSSGGAIPGFYALPQATGASGTVTNVTGFFASPRNTGAGTVSQMMGFSKGASLNSGGGVIVNNYGYYCADETVGTNNYGFYSVITAGSGKWSFYSAGDANNYFAGNVGFGVAPSEALEVKDAGNIKFQTTTGTKIGTATTQKIGFWNATPIVQPTTAVTAATFAANTSGIVDDTATFDGYTIGQVVAALRTSGLLA